VHRVFGALDPQRGVKVLALQITKIEVAGAQFGITDDTQMTFHPDQVIGCTRAVCICIEGKHAIS
jgi:hypothetical protein